MVGKYLPRPVLRQQRAQPLAAIGDGGGEILDALWDLRGENHPMITSMREHRGYLYLGGIANNRIGRYKLEGADPNFVQYDRRWGKAK